MHTSQLANGGEFDVWKSELAHVDRAILEGEHRGFCKILVRKGSAEILGATVVRVIIAYPL
eukprot:SAG11_NODE_14905_length_595_cov_1.506048_2_plen_60_part_01